MNKEIMEPYSLQYTENSFVRIKEILPLRVLKNIQRLCSNDIFTEREINNEIGKEEYIESQNVISKLELILKGSQIKELVESVIKTNIDFYIPRITRLHANDHYIDWHNDSTVPGRVAALSINLFEQSFTGGEFELKDSLNDKLLLSYSNTIENQGVLFKINKNYLDHRVLSPTSGVRTCLILWFYSKDKI